MNSPEHIADALLEAEDFDPKEWVMQNIHLTPDTYGELKAGDILYDPNRRVGEEIIQVNFNGVWVHVYYGRGRRSLWMLHGPEHHVTPFYVAGNRAKLGFFNLEEVAHFIDELRERR